MAGNKQKSGTRRFKPTAQELELQGLNLDIVRTQIGAIADQLGFQRAAFETLIPFFQTTVERQQIEQDLFTPDQQRQRLLDQVARGDRSAAASDQILQQQLDLLGQPLRGPGATDEQRDLINQATEAQIARGESDILDFSRRAIEQVREELAPSRGLRPTDTPIQDRGFRINEEAVRQQGNLVTGLRGQQAQAQLNFPLQANAQQTAQEQGRAAIGQFQQQLGSAGDQFAQGLQQQAFANRLNLFGQTGQLGLGLANIQPQTGLQETFRPQIGQESKSSGGGISSRALKCDKASVDYAKILEAMMGVPVETWHYIVDMGDHERHIGPYAEDFQQAFGIGNGHSIEYMDAIGVLMASVQALTKRVKELEDE